MLLLIWWRERDGSRIVDRAWAPHKSTEKNSIFGGEFMDVPNGDCRWPGWSNCIARRRNRREHQKFLKPGRREHDEIVILEAPWITQHMRDVARSYERIARPENKNRISDDNLQFSNEDKVRFILSRIMPGHAHSRRETSRRQNAPPVSAPVRLTEPMPTSK
jgi:hypothetical protein